MGMWSVIDSSEVGIFSIVGYLDEGLYIALHQ